MNSTGVTPCETAPARTSTCRRLRLPLGRPAPGLAPPVFAMQSIRPFRFGRRRRTMISPSMMALSTSSSLAALARSRYFDVQSRARRVPEAYRAVRPIAEVSVWDINRESAARMVADLSNRGFLASIETDLEAGVRNADIVSAATLATSPLIQGAWLSPGIHVDLIGGFTPKMREADSEAVRRATVYVDTPEALHEAGDLSQPIASTLISANHIRGTLAELARGAISGRSNPQQITLFKAVGSGLADLVAAKLVFCSL